VNLLPYIMCRYTNVCWSSVGECSTVLNVLCMFLCSFCIALLDTEIFICFAL
jgi:hypothetical protein